MNYFLPEGRLIDTQENRLAMESPATLREAWARGQVLEARVNICDSRHNLWVDLGCMQGFIPRVEGALGIEEGSVRDIALISRVNKPVMCKIIGFDKDAYGNPIALLSRRTVQQQCRDEYISRLLPGDIIDAKITHLESFGAFADIGAGITSLLPIDTISVSRIPHPRERFQNGDSIKAVIRGIDENGRVSLSHKELLGTWAENAGEFKAGETVSGIVRSVESYGVFVELAPNLAGLAEPRQDVSPGQLASVYIKNLIPERMKIKLVIIDSFDGEVKPSPIKYYISQGHIENWKYSPEGCEKLIRSDF